MYFRPCDLSLSAFASRHAATVRLGSIHVNLDHRLPRRLQLAHSLDFTASSYQLALEVMVMEGILEGTS